MANFNKIDHPIIYRLVSRKAAIEAHIREELKRPLPDSMRLTKYKRLRLALKDGLARLISENRRTSSQRVFG